MSSSSCQFRHLRGTLRIVSALSLCCYLFIFQIPPPALLSNHIYNAASRAASTESFLLQAEEHFYSRNFAHAETLYDAAISSSQIHKFVNEEALANELAGHFYLETGRKNRSIHYFTQAFEKYNEWGAVAKANALSEYLD